MIVLPIEFVPSKYPGYFWNTESQTLFSVKVDGVLKEIQISHPNNFNNLNQPGYRVSVKGKRKFLPLSYLKTLRATTSVDVYPVKGRYGR